MAGTGFALDEYVIPRCPPTGQPQGGTMPKATNDYGSVFGQVFRSAAKVPGPEHYNTDLPKRPKGGKFSRLERDWGRTEPSPAVGQYETNSALVTPRTRGGIMAKTDRGCFFYDQAMKNAKAALAPGKYDPEKLLARPYSPIFSRPRNESRVAKKESPVGPGYYNPNFVHTEARPISFSSPREATRTYLDKKLNDKEKTLAPGEHGIPESKVEDVSGRRKHTQRLLADRIVTPRKMMGRTM